MKKLLILLITFTFATELEVQGNLKVTGNIDAQNNPITNVGAPQAMTDAMNGNALQDALRDDSQYEFKFILGKIINGNYNTNMVERYSQYVIVSESEGMTNGYTTGLANILNQHSSDGWIIKLIDTHEVGNNLILTYELRRKIEE